MPIFIMVLVAAAALAVLVGVVYVVLGKGGQLARFEADFPPLNLPEGRPVGSRDLGGLLLPLSMWGYHVRAVDELLVRLTGTLREREERIEDLEWRLARLDPSYVPRGTGPRPGSYLPGEGELPADQPASASKVGSVEGAEPSAGLPSESAADPSAETSPRAGDATVGGGKRDDQA
ncbi:hypothetical protein [Nocardiopsis metallicus]|uniref:DivIVA domain-containing protein n=1 Tax=Nocardiopsis metallicus TaxID=179819 RepID=A0A840WM83_9ACTN|nr:hypothetical protein [Nocardiopsis metallicus]MBB5492836.1 hypothetical protein [Nocardiopsis metallicus]